MDSLLLLWPGSWILSLPERKEKKLKETFKRIKKIYEVKTWNELDFS